MTIDYKYMKYLETTENGYKLKENAPKKIIKEIKAINEIYRKNYNEDLIKI